MSQGELELEVLDLRARVRRWRRVALLALLLLFPTLGILGLILLGSLSSGQAFGLNRQRALVAEAQLREAQARAAAAEAARLQLELAQTRAAADADTGDGPDTTVPATSPESAVSTDSPDTRPEDSEEQPR